MEEVFHILAYLQKYKQSKLSFDDMCMSWRNNFLAVDRKDFYLEISELIPTIVPESHEKCMQISCMWMLIAQETKSYDN